ncbi:MAG: hypothetical protein V3T44_04200, partial [bacterium]
GAGTGFDALAGWDVRLIGRRNPASPPGLRRPGAARFRPVQNDPFEAQHPGFETNAPECRKASQVPTGPDDPVSRDGQRNRVSGHRGANRSRRSG